MLSSKRHEIQKPLGENQQVGHHQIKHKIKLLYGRIPILKVERKMMENVCGICNKGSIPMIYKKTNRNQGKKDKISDRKIGKGCGLLIPRKRSRGQELGGNSERE